MAGKTDRLLGIAEHGRMPLIVFAEGGGGRPGDTDYGGFVGQNTFHHFGQLSGLVPMVSIVSGRCFAGNAALLSCCDVIIATKNANIGMGGPAMVEGGGLGVYTPEEVGPMSFQVPNGVVDILVKDEAMAVETAKKYLSYFQGPIDQWKDSDQKLLRHAIPENRLRLYDMREIIHTLADIDSVLEIRPKFGVGLITAFSFLPFGTILSNALGCLLLGFFLSISKEREIFSPQVLQAISVGFLGALTTFSTFTAEAVEYWEVSQALSSLGYVAVNLFLGFVLFFSER